MNIVGVEIASIGAIGCDGKDEVLVNGPRQHEAIVIINVLSNKVDPARRHHEQGLARESGMEL